MIGIIGAGMAGLTCATELVRRGHTVRLFDKGRGAGGRMATRRVSIHGADLRFDHGAQYFTARGDGFRKAVSQWEAAGIVARWPAAGADAHVGTSGMNAPLKAMADGLDVRWNTRANSLQSADDGWEIGFEEGEPQRFDSVIVAIPAEQAAILMNDAHRAFADMAGGSQSRACWAVMVAFEEKLPLPDAYRDAHGPISWAARNSAKPGRGGMERWVLHASPDFSQELLDHTKEDAARRIFAGFSAQHALPRLEPVYLTAHRWLYAMAEPRGGPECLWDEPTRLGVCGDWLTHPRVEGAWQSGHALAGVIGNG